MLMAVWGRQGPGKMHAGVTGVSGGEGGRAAAADGWISEYKDAIASL